MRMALGTGTEVLTVEFVKAGAGESQFQSSSQCAELGTAMLGQDVTNEGRRETFDQLVFFIATGWIKPVDLSL